METVIKNAVYFYDKDTLLISMLSWQYHTVDCYRYKTIDTMREICDDEYVDQVIEDRNFLEYEWKKYWMAWYALFDTKKMDLLSDISNLVFVE